MNPKDPHDRFYFEPAHYNPPCSFCRHRFELVKCRAFPNGIPVSVIVEKGEARNNPEALRLPCNGIDDIHYEPRETD
jgi:hypothetical protein